MVRKRWHLVLYSDQQTIYKPLFFGSFQWHGETFGYLGAVDKPNLLSTARDVRHSLSGRLTSFSQFSLQSIEISTLLIRINNVTSLIRINVVPQVFIKVHQMVTEIVPVQ
jgi:hypothetical protein